jgi:hypothetical protein
LDLLTSNKWRIKFMTKGCATCCVCGEEHGLDDIHHIETKKGKRKICKECVAAIKGFA